jgi:hypothetical protein
MRWVSAQTRASRRSGERLVERPPGPKSHIKGKPQFPSTLQGHALYSAPPNFHEQRWNIRADCKTDPPPDPEKRSPATAATVNGAGRGESSSQAASDTNNTSTRPIPSTWIKLADATEEMLDAYLRQASDDEEGSL